MSDTRPVKPVGGIEAVRLIPAGSFETGVDAVDWPIFEDACTYEEQCLSAEGVPLVRHTLTLVCDPVGASALLSPARLSGMAAEGVVARIETASGVSLLVGWSEKFGLEQPLRLVETRYTTEAKPVRRPALTLVFTGEDTAPATTV